eukprot:755686-Hanusia_phi.AAC.1
MPQCGNRESLASETQWGFTVSLRDRPSWHDYAISQSLRAGRRRGPAVPQPRMPVRSGAPAGPRR